MNEDTHAALDTLAAVREVLDGCGFDDPESHADPAKAIRALADDFGSRLAELITLRGAIDKAVGLKWREAAVCTSDVKDAERIRRLEAGFVRRGKK